MQRRLTALALALVIGMVLIRAYLLKRRSGARVVHFGELDRKDFLIPPFALFYIYTVFAAAFGFPLVSDREFFHSEAAAWVGVALCLTGLVLLLASLVSFGKSFRVGIDAKHPDALITTGVFALTRNPIYVAFLLVLLGQFLAFPNWILLAHLAAGTWLIHRQITREEAFLHEHYGRAYAEYCKRVRRYL